MSYYKTLDDYTSFITRKISTKIIIGFDSREVTPYVIAKGKVAESSNSLGFIILITLVL